MYKRQGPKGASVQFHQDKFPNPAGLVAFLTEHKGTARIVDNKIVVSAAWATDAERIKGAFGVAKDLAARVREGATAAPSGGHEGAAAPATAGGHGADAGGHGGAGSGSGPAWFKFPQQFFVPVLHDGRLDSTMVLSLSVEMPGGATETVYAHELKLRDALLRQMLIHANTGGFDGNFTAEPQLRVLRQSLLGTAQGVVPEINDILIGDIARQER